MTSAFLSRLALAGLCTFAFLSQQAPASAAATMAVGGAKLPEASAAGPVILVRDGYGYGYRGWHHHRRWHDRGYSRYDGYQRPSGPPPAMMHFFQGVLTEMAREAQEERRRRRDVGGEAPISCGGVACVQEGYAPERPRPFDLPRRPPDLPLLPGDTPR